MRGASAVVALALAALGGCTSSAGGGTPGPSFSPNPGHEQLVRAAALDPCPPSAAAAVSGGLPDVTLPCLGNGPAVHLGGLTGRPTVVNIWGSWCGPCQRETPHFAQVYDELKGRVGFLGIDDEDDVNSALDFAAHVRPAMRYPSVVDNDKRVLVALGTSEVPITLFVDASGHVVHRNFGPYGSAAALRSDIARYLGVTT